MKFLKSLFKYHLSIKIILLTLNVGSVDAAVVAWNVDGTGSWVVSGNWSPATIPNAANDQALIAQAYTNPVVLQMIGNSLTVGSMSLDSGNSITIDGPLLSASTLNMNAGGGQAFIDISNGNGNGTHTFDTTLNLVDSLQVRQESTSVATLNGNIIGSGQFLKTGSQTLRLIGTNSYTGTTAVLAGTLEGTQISLQGAFTNDAAVIFDLTLLGGMSPGTYAGAMSGTGSLTKRNAGNLILTGANSYSGGTTVSAGTLEGTQISLQGAFQNDAAVIFDLTLPGGVSPGTYAGSMSGTGSLTKRNAGSLILTGTNTYSGGTTVSAGTLEGTQISLQGTFQNDAAVIFDLTLLGGMSPGTYAGSMSGTGSLTKRNAGSLILTGTNTYSGGTTVSDGILTGDTDSLQGDIVDNAAIAFDQAVAGGYTGVISGTGSMTKLNAGNLTLSGANTYSGGTTISAGMLTGTTTSLQGNIVNNAALEFNQNGSGTYSGNMSGTGGVNVVALVNDKITFIGTNSYAGGTTLSSGILEGDTDSLQGGITTAGGTTLSFDQTTAPASTTFGGTISGTGDLDITQPTQPLSTFTNTIGANDLSLTGATAYTSANASQIAQFVNGNIPPTVLDSFVQFDSTVTLPGTLTITNAMGNFGTVNVTTAMDLQQGTAGMAGTVGPTNNNGILTPGNSIGTLNIVGDYTQTASGTLVIEFNDVGTSDQILITGTANLDGTIFIAPEPGLYFEGQTFNFMTYAARVGVFAQILEEQLFDYTIIYNPFGAQIAILSSGAVLPVPFNSLSGNAMAIAEYLFCSNFLPPDPDLRYVMGLLVSLPANIFERELEQLSPSQFGALPLVELQNQRVIADTIAESAEKYRWCKGEDTNNSQKTSVWVAPVGYYYNQDKVDGQIAFDAYAIGAAVGANHLLAHNILVGGAIGYAHSHIDWQEKAGEGRWNSVYAGPSIGWVPSSGFVNMLVLGAYNYYSIDRTIRFPGLRRTAYNNHHSWDVMARIDGGYKFCVNTKENGDQLFILPEASVSYLNIFESSYTESGAKSLNLDVGSKYSAFLQSNVMIKFLNDFHIKNMCITPTIHVGWISTIPLSSRNYTSSLFMQTTCKSHFTVTSFHDKTNQLSIGCELVFTTSKDLILSLGYNANLLDQNTVQSGKLRLEKRF